MALDLPTEFVVPLVDAICSRLDQLEAERLSEIADQQFRDSCAFCRTNWRDCVCDMQEGL